MNSEMNILKGIVNLWSFKGSHELLSLLFFQLNKNEQLNKVCYKVTSVLTSFLVFFSLKNMPENIKLVVLMFSGPIGQKSHLPDSLKVNWKP